MTHKAVPDQCGVTSYIQVDDEGACVNIASLHDGGVALSFSWFRKVLVFDDVKELAGFLKEAAIAALAKEETDGIQD
jgi:hypothetical protein